MRGVCRARNEEWRTKYGSLYRKYVGRLIIREGERALPLRVESTWPPPSLRSTPRRSNRGGHEVLSSFPSTRRFSSRGRRASWLPSFIFSFLPLVSTIVKCLDRGWMEKGKLEFFGINSNKVWIIFSRTRKYLTDFGTREKINPKSWPIQQFLQIFSSNGKRSN